MKSTTQSGLTLIEILVACAIVGILGALTVPSFVNSMKRGERAEAMALLVQNQVLMQQYYTLNNTFVATTTRPLTGFITRSPKTGTIKYNISITSATATAYTLQAAPVASERYCQTFTVDSSGVKGVTGTPAPTQSAELCWSGK